MKWRYSLRWKRPAPCPGEPELASEVVEAGMPAPEIGESHPAESDIIPCRPVWRGSQKDNVRNMNIINITEIVVSVFLAGALGPVLLRRKKSLPVLLLILVCTLLLIHGVIMMY